LLKYQLIPVEIPEKKHFEKLRTDRQTDRQNDRQTGRLTISVAIQIANQ